MAKHAQNTVRGSGMWYVIWTVTGKEEQAKVEIEKIVPKEYYDRCFIPQKKECRKYHGSWTVIEKALFPGYLFLETEQVEGIFFGLKKLHQFAKVLKTGEAFVPVTDEEEKLIRHLLGDGESVDLSVGIIENQQVRVTVGPLQGLEGMIRKIDRHKRKAYLQVEMFERMLDIAVGLEIVEKR